MREGVAVPLRPRLAEAVAVVAVLVIAVLEAVVVAG